MSTERRRSSAWYLFPIFMGIIGGVIAYFAVRRDDESMAKKCLIIGAILTGIWVGLNYLITYLFIGSLF